VQDVYLKIQGHIGTIEGEEKVDSWVYRVARNAVYDFYRTRKPTQELNELPSPTPDPTEDEMEARLSESIRGRWTASPPTRRLPSPSRNTKA
jgi:RNA polymerase sigma-70 factor (ECF subfamily)